MSIVTLETQGTVAVITMNNGENRHDLEFANAMLEALEKAINDKTHTSLVLTSSDPKSWSQGVNVNWLMRAMQEQRHDDIRAFMYGMNKVFSTLLLCPIPTIAAISGHAFGNGAILSCACDFRMMRSDRGYFCFPEVDLSIPFLPGMIAFVKKAMPYYRFNEMKLSGRRVTADELLEDHVIEKAFPDPESLLEGAIEYASTFKKKRGIFGEHKKRLHKHIIEVMENEDKDYIENLKLMA